MNDNAMERWTEEEEAFLRENFGWLPYREIAKKLGRTKKAVCNKAFYLGISADACSPWTQEDLAFLRENFSSMSSLEIAVRLKKTIHAVRGKAHKLKLRKHAWSRRPFARKAWTKEDVASLREMAITMTSLEIAERMERTVSSVQGMCCRLGIKLLVGKRRQSENAWPPEKVARLRAGAEAGESLSLLAAACGKTVPAVVKALRRLGIKRAELSKTKPYGRPRSRSVKEEAGKRITYEIPEGWISSREAAESVIGVCRQYVGKLCRSGKIEGRRAGKEGSWIVLRESAERYAEERRAELERQLAERLSAPVKKKRPAQSAPKRRKPEPKPQPDFTNEAQVESMSKLDILKALAGL